MRDYFSRYNYKLMDFNIFDIFESITDAQIILSLNIESLFALAPNLSLLE